MQRRHFEWIAAVIRRTGESFRDRATERATLRFLARDFADALEESNRQFDRARFLRACGLEG